MPLYKLFYLRDSQIQKFRESPPKPKPYRLRIGDYNEAGEIEAPTPYAVWNQLRDEPEARHGRREFGVGDVLETEPSSLMILNHWGFDQAEWRPPETAADSSEPEAEQAAPTVVAETP